MPSTPRTILVSLSLSASALALCANAATAAPSISDPTGDVRAGGSITQPQQDTVDITGVRYVVRDDQLIITTRVVDLEHTPGNQFMETEVGTGGSSVTLSSEVGKKYVKLFTGSTLTTCKGASTRASFGQDLVRQVVPIKCLDADDVRLKSSAVLARANGTSIARDAARRSGTVELAAG